MQSFRVNCATSKKNRKLRLDWPTYLTHLYKKKQKNAANDSKKDVSDLSLAGNLIPVASATSLHTNHYITRDVFLLYDNFKLLETSVPMISEKWTQRKFGLCKRYAKVCAQLQVQSAISVYLSLSRSVVCQ